MQALEKSGKLPYVVKVGLHVNDMAQFKNLN